MLYRGVTELTNLTMSLHYLIKAKNTVKWHILKSTVTVFYYSTARMSR